MRRTGLLVALGAVVIFGVSALMVGANLIVDWLWFDSLGYGAVFATTWNAKLAVFGISAVLSAALLVVNGVIAARAPAPRVRRLRVIRGNGSGVGVPDIFEFSVERVPWGGLAVGVGILLGLLTGLAQVGNWQHVLEWLYAEPFGRTDPLFGRDLSFYVFSLPVYAWWRDWGLVLVFLAAAMAAATYWARGAITVEDGVPRVSPAAIRHLSVLLALLFAIKAGDYVLQRYGLMLHDTGVVFGAAYTDVHVRLPLLAALAALAVIAAVLCAVNLIALGFRLPVAAVVLTFGASFLAGVVPNLFQSYRVKPDELRLETPYIEQNIAFTRYGFALDRITSRPFPAASTLTPEVLAANQATIENIRWWDTLPLLETYRQLQELRLYYDFRDVDVDRYTIEGRYRQVMLSARELNQAKLPPDAQTWINLHFKFTHGSGVAMSPVNQFDQEGLPAFFIKDIPPASSVGMPIDRSGLYFGEETRSFVVVRGGTTEFDYARGQENVYTTYDGKDGVALDSLWRRALFAWHLGDVKLLLSGNVTAASRILFRRLVQERIGRLAPFLRLDHDPYIAVVDGRLIWLQDAYTVTDALPYSQPHQATGINYIRNAVKATVDAYDGTVTFYVADPDDPLVRTYQRIFPTLFRPLDAMPAALRQHVRYPEDLFLLQAVVYGTYHMRDPEVFYNKEDQWSLPQEHHGGKTAAMQPYYTIMRLPGEAREEFILMLPMVPNARDNMIAWLAARCDGAAYGSLTEFAFSKDSLVFGPAQIEARIDQDTTISQQLSLWNQTGSRVIRGNLLVIPIDDTLLYVEPLYLRAENRELPELKRLIASSGDRVVMSQTIEPLLAALVGTAPTAVAAVPAAAPEPSGGASGEPPNIATARDHYRAAMAALRGGDWRGFATEMEALQRALEGLAPPS